MMDDRIKYDVSVRSTNYICAQQDISTTLLCPCEKFAANTGMSASSVWRRTRDKRFVSLGCTSMFLNDVCWTSALAETSKSTSSRMLVESERLVHMISAPINLARDSSTTHGSSLKQNPRETLHQQAYQPRPVRSLFKQAQKQTNVNAR